MFWFRYWFVLFLNHKLIGFVEFWFTVNVSFVIEEELV